jgi:hypothetical protein
LVGLFIHKRGNEFIASEYGNNNATISTIRSFMQKDKNKSTEKNRKIQTTTAIEEIAQILYDAIKRYVALPAAVKNI